MRRRIKSMQNTVTEVLRIKNLTKMPSITKIVSALSRDHDKPLPVISHGVGENLSFHTENSRYSLTENYNIFLAREFFRKLGFSNTSLSMFLLMQMVVPFQACCFYQCGKLTCLLLLLLFSLLVTCVTNFCCCYCWMRFLLFCKAFRDYVTPVYMVC